MHGNTFVASGGQKTRRFDDVLSETSQFFVVHQALGTWPGGLHVELTGDDVTECLGGGSRLDEGDLELNYTSICDPRLNATQSLDMAFHVAEFLQRYSTADRREVVVAQAGAVRPSRNSISVIEQFSMRGRSRRSRPTPW